MIDQQQSNETELLNPYVGPRSFSTEQFHLFKGRTVETDELLNLLLARRLVLFYAQSGAGKTSLLNAGLIPTLQQAKEEFEILPVGRVGDSVELPEQVDNIFVFNLLVSLGVSQQNNLLAGLSLNEFLLDLVYDGENFFHTSENPDLLHAPDTTGWQEGEEFVPVKPRVLIIDQFEEIFTVHPEFEDQRKDFFRQISEALAADPYLYVLLSMRGDYYNRMTPYVHLLPDSLRSRYNMEPMREAAALQAVMEPAKQLGRPFTPQVAQKLITYLRRVQTDQQGINSGEDLLGPYVETVQLQVVCFQLWKRLQDVPGNRITQEDVDEVARRLFAELPQQKSAEADPEEDPLATIINTSLSSYYEQAIFQILQEPTVTGIDEYQLRHWFSEELITDVGTRNLLPRGEHETKGIPETAVNLLDKKHHLVRDDMRGGRPFIELVHDSFVEPILSANQRWDENRYRTYPWLEDASRYQENADPALLLRGNRLQAALRQAKKMVGLPEPAQLFLRASQAAEEERERQRELKEKQLEEEKRQQELAHERALASEHRKRAEEAETAKSKQTVLTTIALVLLLLAVVGGLLAFSQRQEAESVAATAIIIKTTAEANATVAFDAAVRAQEAGTQAIIAQQEAIQQKQIADGLRLANQAEKYFNNGEITSTLLLSVEALAAFSKEDIDIQELYNPLLLSAETLTSYSVFNDNTISKAHDIAQGALLEALHSASSSRINEDVLSFRQELHLPSGITNSIIYFGPEANSLATIQDNSLIYWQVGDLVTKTIELPTNFLTPTISTINQNGTMLALANERTIEIYSISTSGISRPEISIQTEPAYGEIETNSKLIFNTDASMLTFTTCIEEETSLLETNTEDKEENSPTPTSIQPTPNPTVENRCFIQIYDLIQPELSPNVCRLLLPNTMALAYLPNDNQFLLSGNRGELNTASQLYILSSSECVFQSISLPASHAINSISVLNDAVNNLLVTVGQGIQYWRLSEENDSLSLNPVGDMIATTSPISNTVFDHENTSLILQTDQSIAYRYDLNISNWPTFACSFAMRNLTITEWRDTFPLENYRETCVGLNFGSHISVSLETWDEAKLLLQDCNVAEARTKFNSINEISLDPRFQNSLHSDFNYWAQEELLTQYVQGNSSCSEPERRAALRALLGETELVEVLMDIANKVRSGQDFFNEGSYALAANEYEDAFQQTTDSLPDRLQALFHRTVVKVYSDICVGAYIDDSEMACNRLVSLAEPIFINTSDFSTVETRQIWKIEPISDSVFSIKVQAEAGTLNPLLMVFKENGQLLSSDSGSDFAFTQNLFAKESEALLIVATGADSLSGAYQITVEEEPSASISIGQTEIASSQDFQLWMFEADANEIIRISMNAVDPSLDPYLVLLDANGQWLAENDDSGVGLNALISNFQVPETGTYFIQATELGQTYGKYELSLEKEIIVPALEQMEEGNIPEGLALLEENNIFNQDNLLRARDYNQICWFGSLWGFAEEVLFACEEAVTLDPNHGGIADSRGVARALTGDLDGAIEDFQQFINWDDAYYDDVILRLEWVEALENGENPFVTDGVLNEELLAYLRGDVYIPPNVDPLIPGEPIVADTSDVSLWSFVLDETATVSIFMNAQDESVLDPLLYLLNESGNEITSDDDGGANFNSLITMTLAAGTYYIRADAYSGSGEYELTLQITDD